MTSQRKLALIILAVASLALFADRVFLGGSTAAPGAASAGVVLSPHADPTLTARIEELLVQTERARLHLESRDGLAHRLGQSVSSSIELIDDLPNAFAVPAAWLADAPSSEEPAADRSPDDVAAFLTTHRLQGVVHHADGVGIVIINNRVVRTGERIAGFTLIRVTADEATFEREGHTAQLRLPRSQPIFADPDD